MGSRKAVTLSCSKGLTTECQLKLKIEQRCSRLVDRVLFGGCKGNQPNETNGKLVRTTRKFKGKQLLTDARDAIRLSSNLFPFLLSHLDCLEATNNGG